MIRLNSEILMDYLKQLYIDNEIKRMKMWNKIHDLKEFIEKNEGIEGVFDTSCLDAEAAYSNGVLKILVKDYLPRACLAEVKGSQKHLRYMWLKTITDAICRLNEAGVYPKFKKMHCIIKVFLPYAGWDTDNRAVKLIIDSLRYSNVIKDDTFDKMAFTVIGDTDRDNPRTEIVCVENCHIMKIMAELNL